MSAISTSLKVVLSLNPTNFYFKLLECLPMPLNVHGIPLRIADLTAYVTPKLNTPMPLFLLLFELIFKASKA